MLYQFLQKFMRLVLQVYFRKIFLTGVNNIPGNKPVLLACNHPNSFLDAVLLAVLLPTPLHFLARSDVFNTPFKRWLLTKLHLIPIYRLQEGAENLHRNEETFAQCYEILKNNGQILIFSEGVCKLEKRLRPLKKGTARLAFGAEANFNFTLDVNVVPVGINYTKPTQFRTEVMISLGKPIFISGYKDLYEQQPSRAILAFNQALITGLSQNMVIIPEKKEEPLLEDILERKRLQNLAFNQGPWLTQNNNWLQQERAIVRELKSGSLLNAPFYPGNTSPGMGTPKFKLGHYFLWPAFKAINKRHNLLLSLGWPFYLVGALINLPPLWLAQKITNQKIKRPEFYASVVMVLGMVLYVLYWISLTLLAGLFRVFFGVLVAVTLLISGYLALHYRDRLLYQARLIRIKLKS